MSEVIDKAMKQSMRAVEQANKDYPNDSDKANRVALGRFLQAGARPNRSGMPLSEYLSGLDEGPVQTDRGAYARAVDNSLDRPVIAIEAALATNSDPGGLPAKYPNGYMTLREYWGERVAAQEKRSIADYEARHGEVPPEIRNMYAAMSERMLPVFDDVAGVLAGTLKTDNAAINQYANDMRGLVAAHAPGGQFAQLGSRSQSEQDQIDSEYGPQGKFMLTSAGRQNYEAQRLLDLWSATDDNYAPASTMSQVQRAVGGFTAPIYNAMTGNSTRLAGEEWDEMSRMSKPDGKYGYAAEMYYRGANDVPGESSVYTPEGRAKFPEFEMTTPQGLVNSTAMNTDYPMARWFQNVGMRAREIPSTIGNALGGGDENQVLNLRDLRRNAYRTTPVYPDGADPQEFDAISRQIKSADDRMAGYNSAQLGPKFADLYNSTIGQFTGKMGRTYLSPVAEDALELPIEAVSDPVNMALNVVAPGVSAATGYLTGGMKGAGGNLIRSLAKAGKRMGDDVGEEMITQGGIQSSMGSIWDYFSPATTSPLTGNKNPNDADYEEVKDAAAVQANYDKQDAAKRYGRLLNRSN